jgi:phospholipid/cholesterol/gamma-HCH transport system substrate-binding protein
MAQLNELQDQLRSKQNVVRDLRQDIDQQRSRLQNIEVEMRINEEYRDWIRSDSQISLGSIGLLGDKYIEISLGRTEEAPLIVPRSVDGWFGTSTEQVVLITGTQQASFAEMITGANDILANFSTLSDQVQSIMGNFEAGEGTVGKFITDPSFYNNLNSTVENANQAMERIANLIGNMGEGQGTLSKLVKDDDLYNRLIATVENVESLTGKIDDGTGTLGQLVNDRAIHEKVDKLIANLEEITGRLNRGEGSLGKLVKDEEFYNSLHSSVDELSGILKDFRSGKGTLGKLATDDALYGNLNEVSSEVVKLIYDFRQDPKKFLTIKFGLF